MSFIVSRFIMISLALAALSALADTNPNDNSPQFSYPAAAAAFASAVAPSQAQLVGQWIMVGFASAPGYSASTDGYWPNGEFTEPGNSGYFEDITTITASTDAFGGASIAYSTQNIGVETGHVYGSVGPFTGVLTATGYQFDLGSATDPAVCNDSAECRFVAGENMLLCGVSVSDPRPQCHTYDNSGVAWYVGLIPDRSASN